MTRPAPLRYLLTSVLTALAIAALANSACLPEWQPFKGYSFINPDIVLYRSDLAAHFLNFRQVYEYYEQKGPPDVTENLEEWRQRVCQEATVADLHTIIYAADISLLEQMSYALRSSKPSLNAMGSGLASNSFVRYLFRHKCTEIIDYLIFAKKCEPYVTEGRAWDESSSRVTVLQQLATEGQEVFLGVKSHYLRLRYAYQILRLLHYASDYPAVLKAHDYLMPKIDNDPSVIEYWLMGHRAGALMALGQNVEASYLYAKIFDRSAGKRTSAHRSFRIKTDEEWQACLLLCRNDRERAALFLMRANTDGGRLVEEMAEIYELYPKHEGLALLLVREMGNLEKDLLGLDFNTNRAKNERFHRRPRKIAGGRVVALQTFVRRVLREKRVATPELWKIAEGYLELLAGNYYFAARSFKDARELVKSDTLRHQLETFELALKITALDKIDDQAERDIYDIRRSNEVFLSYPDFPNFLNDKLSHLYTELGIEGKAFMLRHNVRDLKVVLQAELIEDLLEICRKERKNPFEQLLVQHPDGSSIEKALIDMKATLLMQGYYVEAAYETFREIPEEEWDNYGLYSPFVERVKDCVRCPLPDTATVYNKAELLQKMIELDYQARAQPNADLQARNYYQLGLAWYNMSYFSYDWKMLDYFRSSVSIVRKKSGEEHNVVPVAKLPFGNREHFDTSKARFYFEKARMMSRDAELQAKCAFMAAKCEQSQFYQHRDKGATRTYDSFGLLKSKYAGTAFYARAIAECKYFQAFAANPTAGQ